MLYISIVGLEFFIFFFIHLCVMIWTTTTSLTVFPFLTNATLIFNDFSYIHKHFFLLTFEFCFCCYMYILYCWPCSTLHDKSIKEYWSIFQNSLHQIKRISRKVCLESSKWIRNVEIHEQRLTRLFVVWVVPILSQPP